MDAIEQPRQPAGAPRSTGGQFRELYRREASLDLSADREHAIVAGEAVAAIFTTERASGGAGHWWDAQASLAEWTGKGAAFPKMPDDWTPGRTGGTADSGRRHTHRMTYQGNGVSLRMPSATAIRSFAAVNRSAFDIPVEASNDEGKSITAWVRAVQHGPGSWSVSGLGFGGTTDAQVSEAVASVLEARRPSAALRQAGDLIEKHRQRLAGQGSELHRVRSSWIAAVGYSDVDRLLIMQTRDKTDAHGRRVAGRAYGSHVSREVFEELSASDKPGTIYNLLVKGSLGSLVRTCPQCDRTFAASRTHSCPVKIELALRTPGLPPQDQRLGRIAALRGIRRRRGRRSR